MGKISVHLDAGVEPSLEAPGESCPIGAAQSGFAVASQQLDPTEFIAETLGHVRRAVRAVRDLADVCGL